MKVITSGFKEMAGKFKGAAKRAPSAFSMALNDTNRAEFTQTKRIVSKQAGVRQSRVASVSKKINASPARLRTEIVMRDRAMSLIEFGARQTSSGVTAKPWGKTQNFKHAFIVNRYGGAFVRTSAARFPIKKLWGPVLPNEMVREDQPNPDAFRKLAATRLTQRLRHHLARMM